MHAGTLKLATLASLVGGLIFVGSARGQDVTSSKHNLSLSSARPVRSVLTTDTAAGEYATDEICVFCHFPHSSGVYPLWNRDLDDDIDFTPIDLSSLDFIALQGGTSTPDDDSKICLSCHSALQSIGAVNEADGHVMTGTEAIGMLGTDAGDTMPAGASGAASGFTRRLGADLTNDHPISFYYTTTLADTDGELRQPAVAVSMQCPTCHEPHTPGDTGGVSGKFLRYNRFQQVTPTGGAFSEANDIICLDCHDKDRAYGGDSPQWSKSAHGYSAVADETYKSSAALLREFPASMPVWKVACLNCHDTHTTAGALHLLREGVDEIDTSAASVAKTGGYAAQEEVCFQCHTNSTESALNSVTTVPNIEDAFKLAIRMPITATDQPISTTTEEVHDILDADMTEAQATLGYGVATNRHVECTDCHNPHRVVKKRQFNDNPTTPDAAGTHDHTAPHDNLASGVLRGVSGVEPAWGATVTFMTEPTSFTVKKGDGGTGASTASSSAWVTREYQVCLKCHSNYAYVTPPNLGAPLSGTTPSGTNSMTAYTNTAREFNAPSTHAGEPLSVGTAGGASATYNTNNHRSWHPVTAATGRTNAMRGTSNSSFESPMSGYTGTQTIYCSDCHGASTASYTTTPTGGEDGDAWGPHGSTNNFILKGEWSSTTGASGREGSYSANALCFKCHVRSLYADRAPIDRRDRST